MEAIPPGVEAIATRVEVEAIATHGIYTYTQHIPLGCNGLEDLSSLQVAMPHRSHEQPAIWRVTGG